MIRAAPTKPETEAVPTRISNSGATWPEIDPKQSSEYPSDLQNSDHRPSLSTGTAEVNVWPNEQGWTSTHARETVESRPTTEVVHQDQGLNIRVNNQEKPSEMKTCALSRIHASTSAQHENSPAYGRLDHDSRSLKRPNFMRCRSWIGTEPICYISISGDRPQPRRWSMGASDGVDLKYLAGEAEMWAPTFNIATVRRWCDEFHETRVADWQQTVTDFGQMWKRWCFAQQQARSWQDNLIKEAIKNFWQPLSDFNYVLSVYSFLEGVRNPNLLPLLRRTYMTWRSPEQIKFHEGCDLGDDEDDSSDKNISSDGICRKDDSTATASKYPLTIHQHLRVARICDEVAGELKSLQYWLDEFQNRQIACVVASKDVSPSSATMAQYRWNLTDAAREFSSLAKFLTKHLRDSRNSLCEALGLDPKQVPGGDTASGPKMTVMNYKKAHEIPSPCHGRSVLPRRFWLKVASLQASRIALKANLYIAVMPRKIARRLLEQMMARSMEMANTAREAGDYKAEATMSRLQNKIRKVFERSDQEFPDAKPKMTLLDSETWPAVLNPRKDMRVEVHGHISTPVETLIDMLLSPHVPVSFPEDDLSETADHVSANSTTSTSERPPSQPASGHYKPLTTWSPTVAVTEVEAEKV